MQIQKGDEFTLHETLANVGPISTGFENISQNDSIKLNY